MVNKISEDELALEDQKERINDGELKIYNLVNELKDL
jgi:hypothetical protein